MAAGLGFKDFQAGSVLTAADTNGYMASQANMVFATAAARDAAITSPQEGMVAVLKDSDGVFMYNGTAWIQDSGIATYSSFTPTVSNWTLGNGTVTGLFRVFGKTVHYYGRFEFGSTSAVGGAGTFTITVPETSRFSAGSLQIGQSRVLDTSAALQVTGQTGFVSTTTLGVFWNENPAATAYVQRQSLATATMPFTFATGDFIAWDVVYERV